MKGDGMMSMEKVKAYFAQFGMEQRVLEFEVSSATVELAAQAAGVEPKRIAKTLSFLVGDSCILIVAAGDARVDNKKYKDRFGAKAKMLAHDDEPENQGPAQRAAGRGWWAARRRRIITLTRFRTTSSTS